MAKLTLKQRNHLKSSAFAEPGKRKYPIQDRNHAKAALSRVAQYGTAAEKDAVRRKVHAKYPSIGAGKINKSGSKKNRKRVSAKKV